MILESGEARQRFLRAVTLGLVAASTIALQVVLLRALSTVGYYHFAYLVIGTALLGFGASGTALALLRERVSRHFERYALRALGGFTIAAALSYPLAQAVRPDLQYVLYSLGEAALLLLEIFLLFLPFFFGGFFIGLLLSVFPGQAGRLYATNLVGSGLGGVLGVGVLFLIPAARAPETFALVGVLALGLWVLSASRIPGRRLWGILAVCAAAAGVVLGATVEVSYDQYKEIAQLERLRAQGSAERVAHRYGPRGQIDVYRAQSLHSTLFASPTGPAPPPQLSVLEDGHGIGTVFRIDEASAASVLDATPQSVAYRLRDDARVLLLGEVGGVNVWLARRFGAEHITVVQRNPQLTGLLQNELDRAAGGVYRGEDITIVSQDPRLFLERTRESYDIIHVVTAEGMPAGAGGLGALQQNYLLTTEAMRIAFSRLSPRGLISITRGVHIPPRDNVRVLATLAAGIEGEAARHLVQLRNYLAVTTLASRRPLGSQELPRVREIARELILDIEHYPGLAWGDRSQRNTIPGPEGARYSYVHHAAQEVLSGDSQAFFADWVYDVRPPTDDSPYFHSYFKWSSISRYVEAFGEQWFRRIELAYAVVTITFVQVTLLALVLILVPILVQRRRRRRRRPRRDGAVRNAVSEPVRDARRTMAFGLLHFIGIGFGFMFFEILLIQRLTQFMGDPIYSTAAVLTGILVFAGIGSAMQHRLSRHPSRRIMMAGGALVALGVLYLLLLDPLLGLAVGLSTALRFALTVVVLLPVSVVLGVFFPAGVAYISGRDAELVPTMWAANGVASVSATPLALLLSMAIGFRAVFVLALALYFVVAVSAGWWKRPAAA